MKRTYETPNGVLDGSELKNMGIVTDAVRLVDGRESRATTRTVDFRAYDAFFSKITEIGRDILINKLPVTLIAEKHQISRKTVWRYLKRLKPDAKRVRKLNAAGRFTWELK